MPSLYYLYLVLILIFVIPYNVDRPTRRIPYVTYWLIALNTFIFLMTIVISNINLPADKVQARQEIAQLIKNDKTSGAAGDSTDAALKALDTGDTDKTDDNVDPILWLRALKLAADKTDEPGGYMRLWQIQHVNDSVVLEPHWSILDLFAYRSNAPTFGAKILGMIGSMFLHEAFPHLIGNMLFLWVFGRALEDTLGPIIFLGSYLLCGVAATLMYHGITVAFMPQAEGIPLTGASGAIAGVLGLFALRFYRTPVRLFYLTLFVPAVFVAVFISFLIVTYLWFLVLHDTVTSLLFALVTVVSLLGVYGRPWAWGSFKAPSAWVIGFWLLALNLVPAVMELFYSSNGGGTAYWAHIGGFTLGMMYGLLIGSKEEGKTEFMLEDAQRALLANNASNAIAFAEILSEREPENGAAYEVLAKAYEAKREDEKSLDYYELAIQKYIRAGAREEAARLYIESLKKHPRFIMDPPTQLALGTQLAKDGDMRNAAETLVKIPYTFPEAPEGEISLLRSAQLYMNSLAEPEMALQLLKLFLDRYPESEWLPQAHRAYGTATGQLRPTEEPLVEQALLTSEIVPPKP